MPRLIKTVFFLLYILLCHHSYGTEPWFTGPLLAPAGHTVPRGHTNLELYGFDIITDGIYDSFKTIQHVPVYRSQLINPIITHGFTDWLDVQLVVPYMFNSSRGAHYNHIADTGITLGIQLWEQNKSAKQLDVRLLLQETIPTGHFNGLDPLQYGTDSTGLGSYQTQIGLNFQYLLPVLHSHYLRTRFIISRLLCSPVFVHGLNSYGGTASTRGNIRHGDETDFDLAFEFTLDQHWVAVMEAVKANGQASRFNGILNIGNIGGPGVTIGSDAYLGSSLAPAIEYNFNEHIGLIGGVWFSIAGKNTAHFTTYVLALNTYW